MTPDRDSPGLVRRHGRFLTAMALGLLAGLGALALPWPAGARMLAGVDVFFAAYILLMSRLLRMTPDRMRARAATEDEGIGLILALAALAIGISLFGILSALRGTGGGWLHTGLALAALPLGWAMMQTLAAFHYAHLYYRPLTGSPHRGGLAFAETKEPGPWDFLYFAFVIGMTAQVSDVVVTDAAMRRTVLAHSVVAFFTNTVILALAVAAVAS